MNLKTLFVSDLDGTLLTAAERISAYSLRLLNEMIDGAGLCFTYATARSLNSAAKALWGLRQVLPVVLYNGAVVMEPWSRRMLYNLHFDGAQLADLRRYIEEEGVYPIVYSFSKDGKERLSWVAGKESAGMLRYLSRREGDLRLHPVASYDELAEDEVFYFNCIESREKLEGLCARVRARQDLKCIFEQETYQTDYWCEIMPAGTSKGEGALRVKRLLGAEKLVVFGDAPNDRELFLAADESYAVMNADEGLKALATGVIGYSEEDAVVKFLAENLHRYL